MIKSEELMDTLSYLENYLNLKKINNINIKEHLIV